VVIVPFVVACVAAYYSDYPLAAALLGVSTLFALMAFRDSIKAHFGSQ